MYDHAIKNVSPSCSTHTARDLPSPRRSSSHKLLLETNMAWYYSQWGKEKHEWSGSSNLSIYSAMCREARQAHYDEVELKARAERDRIIQTCNNWKSFIL